MRDISAGQNYSRERRPIWGDRRSFAEIPEPSMNPRISASAPASRFRAFPGELEAVFSISLPRENYRESARLLKTLRYEWKRHENIVLERWGIRLELSPEIAASWTQLGQNQANFAKCSRAKFATLQRHVNLLDSFHASAISVGAWLNLASTETVL